LFLWGPPGIGKSAFVRQAAEREGWTEAGHAFVEIRLSQMEPVDLRGLPVPDRTARKTDWLPPAWLPFEGSDWPETGVLFLDEASSATPSVQAAAYQLVLDRQLGEAKLKKGWRLVLAGNRVTDGGVAFRLSMPLANRMLHVEVRPSLEAWTRWALDCGIHWDVLGFLQFRPSLLMTFEGALKSREVAFATPRSWEMVSKILAREPDTRAELLETLVAAAVGPGVASEFIAWRALKKELPDLDAVLAGKAVACADKADVRYAAAVALASRIIETGQRDMQRAQADSQRAIVWLDKLDVRFAALFINFVRRRNKLYLLGNAHTEWVTRHRSLLQEAP
jgi:MoxR-like ATPase